MKLDWKKGEKEYYLPKTSPAIIKVPAFKFFMIEGEGNPNDPFFGDYISVLYSLSYAVKMSPKKGNSPAGYVEYTVYPLEGVWDLKEEARNMDHGKIDKNSLVFNLMIRQPDFVDTDFAAKIIETTASKKPHPLLEKVRFGIIEEGKCVQMMHLGSYDDEPGSFARMHEFCKANSLERMSMVHREIYLSDARKVTADKLKTVLRFRITDS
ncbi:MAG: GyrI-like domain-containing protein [Bacteroidales bacterium]